MTTVIDKRYKVLDTTFADLNIGECYQDCNTNRLCMKTDWATAIEYHEFDQEWKSILFDEKDVDMLVIPLTATLTVDRKS